ncbi:S24 family peptidase [Novosphingobium sp. B 225]|uniref:S24 family peptidase n=1 Tax=Novosphingobium sp. B 225 TaxID=1961849 RepID=UPI001595E45F|nr:S24 family peptidase [Novosphingobium sp. B 225]
MSRRRDGTYVLRMEDSLNVKRIAIEPQGRKISVASDNPFHASWNNRKRRAVHIVGRVLWFGCKMH